LEDGQSILRNPLEPISDLQELFADFLGLGEGSKLTALRCHGAKLTDGLHEVYSAPSSALTLAQPSGLCDTSATAKPKQNTVRGGVPQIATDLRIIVWKTRFSLLRR
jgi:hypothetical protein